MERVCLFLSMPGQVAIVGEFLLWDYFNNSQRTPRYTFISCGRQQLVFSSDKCLVFRICFLLAVLGLVILRRCLSCRIRLAYVIVIFSSNSCLIFQDLL